MFKQLSHTFTAGTIAVGALLLSPLTVSDAFRAQAAFEQCMNDDSFKSPGTNRSSQYTITAHRNISQHYKYVNIYWVDFNGKWVFYKTLYPGQSYVQQTYIGHNWVAQTNSGACEYFSAQQAWDSYNVGEYLD